MSDSENICVCCRHPIVDETIEGDMTLRVEYLIIDFKDLALGVDSKCRNCAVILDAIVTFVGDEDRSLMQLYIPVCIDLESQELRIDIGVDIYEDIVVLRYSDFPRNFEPSKSDVWNFRESRPLSGNTSSRETIHMIQGWKANCMQHHECCMQRLAVPLPKRILEITAECIILREKPGSLAPYACLSHCWGSKGPAIKLTAKTFRGLRDGVKTSDLPKTFRDAVEVCRHLGIYYIWIDALCIFQDSEEDWKEAAATMGDIYENSHITIAATASQDSNGGLFSSDCRVTRGLEKHPHLHVQTSEQRFPSYTQDERTASMPLLSRAWVYQERRLSKRTIHFGKHQVYWECQTCFASEDSREDKTWNKHVTDFDNAIFLGWGDNCVDHKTYWHKTVMEYTMLQLTFESDRLPAIAAVVDRMSRLQRVDDVYIAGLWKNSILSDLLWSIDVTVYVPRPARMAPSWSWVSAQNSAILWRDFEFTKETKVLNLEYSVVGAANLGEVTNASIILMVPVLNLTAFDELNFANIDDGGWETRFESISESIPVREQFRQNNLEIFDTHFCPDYDLTTANPPTKCGCTIKLLVARDHSKRIGGIVVQQTSDGPEYKRIGFLHVWLKQAKPKMAEKKDKDSVNSEHDGSEDDEEIEEGIDNLTLSLPMEEVKIV